jgi:trans-aconitate methyltransferase
MNREQQRIQQAYDEAVVVYREKYAQLPARTEDIDLTRSYTEVAQPRVLEIGCAYGREAQYILQKTPHYTGIDISQSYIDMARQEVPAGTFVCADVHAYEFPSGIDMVFAFASLLHSDKESMQDMLLRLHPQLSPNAVIFLSLKRREEYGSDLVTDGHTQRKFYYYTRQTILELCDGLYSEVFYDEQLLKEPWFTMILKKNEL